LLLRDGEGDTQNGVGLSFFLLSVPSSLDHGLVDHQALVGGAKPLERGPIYSR
jgi:hypothetical protein